jgi:hypothetical protein
MKPNYRQCQLTKDNKKRVAWIPSKFALVGKVIKIKDDNGEWNDGWIVERASSNEVCEDYLVEHERDYKHQREASDI